jgi:hypothetical protein
MAEAPAVAETQTSASQPAPVVASFGELDAAMANARAAATAQQAALEQPTPETPQPAPEDATATGPPAAATPATDQPAPVEGAQEDGGEDQDLSADQQQPGKPSRMGRLREQLTQADQRARDAEAKLEQRLAVDTTVRQKYAALLGTPDEKARLEATIADPTTTTNDLNQARSRLGQMRQAQTELGPLYAAVEEDVFAGFVRGLDTLRTLDGMDDQAHQSLFKAKSGVEALRLMHGVGRKAAEDEFKGEIASLKAQVSDLKTKQAATGAQPAGAGGRTPGGTNGLAGLLGADGLPTEEAIARARAGGLRHLGQPAAA